MQEAEICCLCNYVFSTLNFILCHNLVCLPSKTFFLPSHVGVEKQWYSACQTLLVKAAHCHQLVASLESYRISCQKSQHSPTLSPMSKAPKEKWWELCSLLVQISMSCPSSLTSMLSVKLPEKDCSKWWMKRNRFRSLLTWWNVSMSLVQGVLSFE